jgi:AraC-like DNA-binding protein
VISLPNHIGQFNGMSDDVRFVNIAIAKNYFDPLFNVNDLTLLHRHIFLNQRCHFSADEMAESLAAYQYMKKTINEGVGLYKELVIKGYLQALVFRIISKCIGEQQSSQTNRISRQQEIYNRFTELVQQHCTQQHSIKYYADALCITPKYLSRVVHEASGSFAGDIINDYLINEAKALIRSRKYTILQISEMLNFTSQSFFCRFFKNAVGSTPLQYQDKV